MKKNIGYPDWLYNNTALDLEYKGVSYTTIISWQEIVNILYNIV